jgi:hypothetical protein
VETGGFCLRICRLKFGALQSLIYAPIFKRYPIQDDRYLLIITHLNDIHIYPQNHMIHQSIICISIFKDIIDAQYSASHESLIHKIYLSLLLKVNRE